MGSARLMRRRSRSLVVGTGAVALALISSAAGAAVTAGEDAALLGAAMTGSATVTGTSLQVDYDCVADDSTTPDDETVCPTGVGDSPLAGFPTNGGTFGMITTGNAALADDPNTDGSAGEAWGLAATTIGPDVYDHQVVRIDLGPASGSCLAFDFKFLSEEFPEFIDSGFNDAFVAQLNTWSVTADPATQTLTAPGDFAAGTGDSVSVDGIGPSAMDASLAAGTTYDAATLPLVARTRVTPGSTNSLYLTIFDQGDAIYDSAAFVDNIRFENLPPSQCKSLAVEPFEGTSGVVVVPGSAGTFGPSLSTFTINLASNLPSGPIDSNVSATASFVDWGDTLPRSSARGAAKATTAFGSGTTTIPAGGSGNLVLTTTPEGVAAVESAQKEPASLRAHGQKLKKKAKKLKKRAAKLKKKAKKLKKAHSTTPKKAKKLAKKAKKLKKKAKRTARKGKRLVKSAKSIARQPLGTVVVTVTNASNAKSETFRVEVPR